MSAKIYSDTPCLNCKGPIKAHGKRKKTAKWCSHPCRLAYLRRTWPKQCCEQCGIKLDLHRPARFCSKKCQADRTKAIRTRPLTAQRVRDLLRLDETTGALWWKENPIHAGRYRHKMLRAGHLNDDGYTQVRVDGHSYLAHRLIWLHVHGEWPPDKIDHKDGIASGDGIANLRLASQQQNTWNQQRSKANKSGFKGVSLDKSKRRWRATIRADGKQQFLGAFEKPEDAHAAYIKAALHHRGEFARVS